MNKYKRLYICTYICISVYLMLNVLTGMVKNMVKYSVCGIFSHFVYFVVK